MPECEKCGYDGEQLEERIQSLEDEKKTLRSGFEELQDKHHNLLMAVDEISDTATKAYKENQT